MAPNKIHRLKAEIHFSHSPKNGFKSRSFTLLQHVLQPIAWKHVFCVIWKQESDSKKLKKAM